MASVSKDHGGGYRVLVSHAGKRHAIRLGKVSKSTANTIADRLESLRTARRYGMPVDGAVAAWLQSTGDDLFEKIAATGLIQSRRAVTCQQLFDTFLTGEKKPNTIKNLRQSVNALAEFLPLDTPVRSVTTVDAEAIRSALAARYARATWTSYLKRAKGWFTHAEKSGLIEANPFAGIKCPASENADRKAFIDRETIDRVLAHLPDPQWRCVLCLSRYGGLRIPSEALDLQWSDIDWKRQTITIRAHKTKGRVIPLFREVRAALEALDRDGSNHVITRSRNAFPHWRRVVLDAIYRAGLKPWPKLFHNLRASRQTELAEQFGVATACQWIGNSAAVATTHYLTVRPEDFARAVA